MFKKTIIAAGIIASSVAFTINTMAATLSQTIVGPVVYAQELFGPGSDAVVLTNGAAVTLTTAGTVVDTGEISDFTFTLSNGVLGAAVNLITDVVLTSGLGEISVTILAGGAAGDSSVTFRIEVITDLAIGDTIAFLIPTVTGASGLADVITPTVVSVGSSVATFATGGVGTFPTTITQTGTVIASAADEVAVVAGAGTDGTIDVDARADINGGATQIDHDADAGAVTATRDGLSLGTVMVSLNGAGVESDGAVFSFATAGAGTLEVTATGPFNAGDTVCVDLDAGLDCDLAETCTIVGMSATCSIPLAALGGVIYYVANGTTELAPALYSASSSTAYTLTTNLTETVGSSANTTFDGLFPDSWSMVVPKSTSADQANIRVTNETALPVSLFAQGWGQDGVNLGFIEITTIAPNSTVVMGAADFEALYGSWSGRARFDFWASGNVSTQSFIRSGGVLNNMTGSSGTSNAGAQELR